MVTGIYSAGGAGFIVFARPHLLSGRVGQDAAASRQWRSDRSTRVEAVDASARRSRSAAGIADCEWQRAVVSSRPLQQRDHHAGRSGCHVRRQFPARSATR